MPFSPTATNVTAFAPPVLVTGTCDVHAPTVKKCRIVCTPLRIAKRCTYTIKKLHASPSRSDTPPTTIRPITLQQHDQESNASHPPTPSTPSTNSSTILIIGANRGLGLSLLTTLRKNSSQTTPATIATTHRPASAASPAQTAHSTTVHALDVTDPHAVTTLLQTLRPRTVFCCIGGEASDDANVARPDFAVARALVDGLVVMAGERKGKGADAVERTEARGESEIIPRFVFVSALGAGDSEGSVPFQVMATLRPLLLEKSHAEAYIRANATNAIGWTIVRPAPLSDHPLHDNNPENGVEEGSEDPGEEAVVTEDVNCYGTVSRIQVAKSLLRVAESRAAIGKTLHVVDKKGVLVTAPYVRPLEFWEPLPFHVFEL